LNLHYSYFFILAASLAGPLALSFDKKVTFYKKWKYLFPAMILPAVIYVLWDIYFTANGVWGFNEAYITGIKIINLPIEEVLFFFIVPYCCVFIYECICCYFPNWKDNKRGDTVLKCLALALAIAGVIFYDRHYTCWTFLLTAFFIAVIYTFRQYFILFNTRLFLISYGIILVPFLIVNGFLTAMPIVMYNNEENLGVRIYTIPFEDIFYGMLLVLMNIVIYEKLKNSNTG